MNSDVDFINATSGLCGIFIWPTRELERQINSLLFEQLALSHDKEGVLRLAQKGHEIQSPASDKLGRTKLRNVAKISVLTKGESPTKKNQRTQKAAPLILSFSFQ